VKSDRPYLLHVVDAIAAIETYVAGGRDTFVRERLIQDPVVRNFEIIGEAASRLSPALRDTTGAPLGQGHSFPQPAHPRLLEHRPATRVGRD
jgi:hypothetical protein